MKVKRGEIVRYNYVSGLLTVQIGEDKHVFGITSWDPGRRVEKSPLSGEVVEVVFTKDGLPLCVWPSRATLKPSESL